MSKIIYKIFIRKDTIFVESVLAAAVFVELNVHKVKMTYWSTGLLHYSI